MLPGPFHVAPSSTGYRQLLYRWHLASPAAALWQLAMKDVCQPLGIRATWFDLEWSGNQFGTLDDQRRFEVLQPAVQPPPAAVVIGIDRENFATMVEQILRLRQLLKRWPVEVDERHDSSLATTFTIGWFPTADHQAIQLLHELGADLVLYHPARLRAVLERIARFGHRSPPGRV